MVNPKPINRTYQRNDLSSNNNFSNETLFQKVKKHYIFHRAIKKLLKSPRSSLNFENKIIADLFVGWDNIIWSAHDEYMLSCIRNSLTFTSNPILECGSGLTTIIVGIIAKETGNTLWTLEHSEFWEKKVRKILEKYNINSVHLIITPLRNYGDYYWYDPPLKSMPDKFGLVICDGPPGRIKGGRYGLVPLMKNKFDKNYLILLDDAARSEEQFIAD